MQWTKWDKYPKDCRPQPSAKSWNDLWAVMKALHDQAAQIGNEVAQKMIIEGFKNKRYNGRAPKSLSETKQVIKSLTCDSIELAKEVAKRLHYNNHFYRTTFKDELNKEGAKGSTATRPWTLEPNGKQGKDPKHMILQVAIRRFSRKRATLNKVKYGGELTLYQRKPDKKKVPNKFFVPLADGRGSLTYLAVDKKGNSQLEALDHTPTLEKLPGLLFGDDKKLHALGSSFVEGAKNKGKSLEDIIELVHRAYNTNRSIGPEPYEAGDDTKLSELDFSPLDMTDRFFSGSSLHMLADASEKQSFDEYNQQS